ncbi:MAG: DUF547 domain-containing protein [Candidatus Competibacteraceae bacterium]|nr:MAG: DUF547 domain-containing protein [Candidatus Competibacteraceae bacterium]
MYKNIGDYGLIGNLLSVALVGRDGAIDWLCLPHIDSPSVFAALLDDEKGGTFVVHPTDEWDSITEYVPDTNVLQTRFRTRTGVLELTDFMPIHYCGAGEWDTECHTLYRRVEVARGEVEVDARFQPRFDYARAATALVEESGAIVARANGEELCLAATQPLAVHGDTARARWRLRAGERIWLRLVYGDRTLPPLDPDRAAQAQQATEAYWRRWLSASETGRCVELGPYKSRVDRSALALKLLYYEPTGAIAAAATTSLPEEIGGERNWDYRFTWIRDTAFTLQALFGLGHLSETHGYLRWIESLLAQHGAATLQIMYGVHGETDLPEETLDHLDGYKGSRPVRAGNGAAHQRQLDIYGEIMDAALKLADYVGKIDNQLWPLLRGLCDHVVAYWREPDSGIWEVRNGPYHFVYSKVMCWVALDRGLIIAKRYGFAADLAAWETTRAAIHHEVCARGWREERRAFVQHYDTDALDAVNLLIPLVGFLPFADARVVATIEAIQQELTEDGFVHRYRAADGLAGGEGTFLLCSFWLVDCLVGLGRLEEAERWLARLETTASPLGLFAEEYDPHWRELLGNFPQAFTHIGYINSVLALRQARSARPSTPALARPAWWGWFGGPMTLNAGPPPPDAPSGDIAGLLKDQMNVLRGAFFDAQRGRVAYEAMSDSGAYRDYVTLSRLLARLDLARLQTREERLAFWINLYNVIVIHAVIELGIRDSIKEVWGFFRRVRYQIGECCFSPDDIEHGILRANRRPPNALTRPFAADDPRLHHIVRPLDPRLHFTLVCASSSCPPISVYTAEKLEEQLAIAAETFLNAGGAVIDRARDQVLLSRIFHWYGADFGADPPAVLRFIAPYLHRAEDRRYLTDHADRLTVVYQDYDWRLNRS